MARCRISIFYYSRYRSRDRNRSDRNRAGRSDGRQIRRIGPERGDRGRFKTASREDDFEVTVYDKYNNPMRYLKGSFRSVDGKNTYKVSGLKLRNVQEYVPECCRW